MEVQRIQRIEAYIQEGKFVWCMDNELQKLKKGHETHTNQT